MKKIAVFTVAAAFLFGSLNVFAQSSIDDYVNLSEEQRDESKALQEQYKEEKADLELQLAKLVKDRQVAVRDKNVSLVERRTQEIKDTRVQIKNLAKEYSGRYLDILTDEQKSATNAASDFYAKELASEQAKMEAAEKKVPAKAKPAARPKKSSAKKKTAAKAKSAGIDRDEESPIQISKEEREMIRQAARQQ